MDVSAWLAGLGLERYAAAFEENGVDAALLSALTNEDLKDLGVARVADRKRLLKAIEERSVTHGRGEAGPASPMEVAGERRQVTGAMAYSTRPWTLASCRDPPIGG